MNKNVIKLDEIFDSRETNFLAIIFDRFMDKLMPIYKKGKINGQISDFGGEKMYDWFYYLCKFIDSLGVLFFDKHERIIIKEDDEDYGLSQLAEQIEQWRDNRAKEALTFLFKDLGPDNMKNLK